MVQIKQALRPPWLHTLADGCVEDSSTPVRDRAGGGPAPRVIGSRTGACGYQEGQATACQPSPVLVLVGLVLVGLVLVGAVLVLLAFVSAGP